MTGGSEFESVLLALTARFTQWTQLEKKSEEVRTKLSFVHVIQALHWPDTVCRRAFGWPSVHAWTVAVDELYMQTPLCSEPLTCCCALAADVPYDAEYYPG